MTASDIHIECNLDLATGISFNQYGSVLKTVTICRARRWTSEYFEVWVDQSAQVPLLPRIFDKPVVENMLEHKRDISCLVNKTTADYLKGPIKNEKSFLVTFESSQLIKITCQYH